MNAGRRLQVLWRWNGRPLRVRIARDDWRRFDYVLMREVVEPGWHISWERWDTRGRWVTWRAYGGTGTLRQVVGRYRDYADGWRGRE